MSLGGAIGGRHAIGIIVELVLEVLDQPEAHTEPQDAITSTVAGDDDELLFLGACWGKPEMVVFGGALTSRLGEIVDPGASVCVAIFHF
jgi:hypothetical protein